MCLRHSVTTTYPCCTCVRYFDTACLVPLIPSVTTEIKLLDHQPGQHRHCVLATIHAAIRKSINIISILTQARHLTVLSLLILAALGSARSFSDLASKCKPPGVSGKKSCPFPWTYMRFNFHPLHAKLHSSLNGVLTHRGEIAEAQHLLDDAEHVSHGGFACGINRFPLPGQQSMSHGQHRRGGAWSIPKRYAREIVASRLPEMKKTRLACVHLLVVS